MTRKVVMDGRLVALPILIPAIGGLLCYILSRPARRTLAPIAVISALLGFAASVLLVLGQDLSFSLGAVQIGPLAISLDLKADALSRFVNLFVGLFGALLSIYSVPFAAARRLSGRYWAYFLWALAGSSGAVLSNNLLFFLIAWEVVTVMLYLLVNLGGTEEARAGAGKSFVILGLSDCAILLGVILLGVVGNLTNLSMDARHVEVNGTLTTICYLLFLTGALAKAGAFPLHTWIPAAAEGAPTPVMALLPASLDKLLGIYFLAVISLRMFALTSALKILLMALGAITILGAVMMAMVQHELKKLLSFHAISQVGYMVLGIGTGVPVGIIGGLFHMINHAIYKTALFLGAGAVERQVGTTELEKLGGLARRMPATFVGFLVAALAISGIPPLNGFASKWMVYQGVLMAMKDVSPSAWIFLTAAVFGSALTLASFIKATHSVFWGKGSPEIEAKSVREAPAEMTLPILFLAALCVLFGVWFTVPVNGFLLPSFEILTGESFRGSLAGIWSATSATTLILLGVVLGLVLYLYSRVLRFRVVRPFVGGEVLPGEAGRFVGTDFYRTISEAPGLRAIYRDANAGAFDIYHVGGKYGNNLVQVLRRLHSGLLPTYMGWVILGLVLVVMFLLAR